MRELGIVGSLSEFLSKYIMCRVGQTQEASEPLYNSERVGVGYPNTMATP